jgi:ATP-binding cassette, subfamily B, bacterial
LRAPEEPRSTDAPPADGDGRSAPRQQFDFYEHQQQARESKASLRAFPATILSALRMVVASGPRLFGLTAVAQLAQALLLLVQVLFAKLALEALLTADREGGELRDVLPPFIGLIAAAGVASLAAAVVLNGQRLLGELVQRRASGIITEVTTAVDLESFESPQFFDDLQRVRADALMQPQVLAQGLVGVLGGLLGVVGLTAALLVIEPLIAGLLLVAALPLWALTRRTGGAEYRFKYRQTPGMRLRLYLLELMCGREAASELRAFDLRSVLQRQWETSYTTYLRELRVHVKRRLLLAATGVGVTAVVTSAAFGVLVWMVLERRVSLAEAGAAVLAIRLLSMRVEQLLTSVGKVFEASLLLRDMDRFLLRAPRRAEADRPAAPPFESLALKDVHFRYPGARADALRGVSLEIRRGEVVALVGENGSGKTTLAKLIAALFRPTGGRVLWNGTDLDELDRRTIRQQIGVTFQDFVRYELTARDNIAFGRTDAGDADRVVEAAVQAGAHDALARLPDGYETILGKRFRGGQDLSIGQWQRVALARAFFRDAQLLILDEPTASLDARSEHALFERVQRLAEGRSVLLISHRFSTVRSADRIHVLEKGRVVEQGTHDELMALEGRYAEMFVLQASAYR